MLKGECCSSYSRGFKHHKHFVSKRNPAKDLCSLCFLVHLHKNHPRVKKAKIEANDLQKGQ